MAHGPRNDKNFSRKVNVKAKKKAFYTVLSQKFRDNEILFLDKVEFSKPKTKEALEIINAVSKIGGFEKLKTKKKTKLFWRYLKKSPTFQKAFAIFPVWKFQKLAISIF